MVHVASALLGCVSKNWETISTGPKQIWRETGVGFPDFYRNTESLGHKGNHIAQGKDFNWG